MSTSAVSLNDPHPSGDDSVEQEAKLAISS